MLLPEEVEETRKVSGVTIATPSGWQNVTHVVRTIPMRIFRLVVGVRMLEGAAKHGRFEKFRFRCFHTMKNGKAPPKLASP